MGYFFSIDECNFVKTSHDYKKTEVLGIPGRGKTEIIRLETDKEMPLHFHPTKDEALLFLNHSSVEVIVGREKKVIEEHLIASFPRGITHAVAKTPGYFSPTQYLAIGYEDEKQPSIWPAEVNYQHQFGIYPINSKPGQKLALGPMGNVQRWQKEGKPSDPEEYLERSLKTKSQVKILVFYDQGECVGSAFVGAAEGYDIPKTRAIVQHAGGDPDKISDEDININYQSWEDTDTVANPYAFSQENLPLIWGSFIAATKLAFPQAKAVVVRSRHKEIWSYVYTRPWEIICESNLHNPPFEWTAPDGEKFKGYDERFSNYGILRLPLV